MVGDPAAAQAKTFRRIPFHARAHLAVRQEVERERAMRGRAPVDDKAHALGTLVESPRDGGEIVGKSVGRGIVGVDGDPRRQPPTPRPPEAQHPRHGGGEYARHDAQSKPHAASTFRVDVASGTARGSTNFAFFPSC